MKSGVNQRRVLLLCHRWLNVAMVIINVNMSVVAYPSHFNSLSTASMARVLFTYATETIEGISILLSDLYLELEGEGWPLKP